MGMETESGRDGEMEARREMGGEAKEEWRERKLQLGENYITLKWVGKDQG